MADLAPFRGLRYALEDPAAVTAPPYDAIDAGLAQRLRAASPHNVVRLELGTGDGDTGRYERAAATYRGWLDEGVLRADPRPGFYPYEQRCRVAGVWWRQRGVLAALALTPWEDGIVVPHEHVHRGPIEDRLRLLRALPVNTSPVYVIAGHEPAEVGRVLDEVTTPAPLATITDEDGVEHRLWFTDDPAHVTVIRDGYANAQLLMADGHHRYTTALEYLQAHPQVRGADRILAYVVAAPSDEASGEGPMTRPVHRAVSGVDPATAERQLSDWGLAALPVDGDGDTRDLTAAVLAALRTTSTARIGWVSRQRGLLLAIVDEARAEGLVAEQPAPVKPLDAALVDGLVAALSGGAPPLHTADADAAAEALGKGTVDLVLLTRGLAIDTVRRVARAGARLPPKSTSFFPKPRTGLVLRAFEPPST